MYERLSLFLSSSRLDSRRCVYINMEQNSRTNNRKATRERELSLLPLQSVWILYMFISIFYIFFVLLGLAFFPSEKLKKKKHLKRTTEKATKRHETENWGKWETQHGILATGDVGRESWKFDDSSRGKALMKEGTENLINFFAMQAKTLRRVKTLRFLLVH